MTDQEASAAQLLLHAYRQLLANHAWQTDFAPKLAKLEREHTESCCAIALTPEKRSEHVHAVSVLSDLRAYAERKVTELDAAMKAYAASPREDYENVV